MVSCVDERASEGNADADGTSSSESNSIEIPSLDILSRVDSVIYQNVFQLENGQFLAIAEPMENKKEGLCLQLLEMKEDSSMNLISHSSYGYDSRIYYPTFFEHEDHTFLLVNTGERESWGNKIIELKGDEFIDRGYVDAAIAIRNEPGDEYAYRFGNIAEQSIVSDNEPFTFSFACDSLILFDDKQGALDTILSSKSVRYTLKGDQFKLETIY